MESTRTEQSILLSVSHDNSKVLFWRENNFSETFRRYSHPLTSLPKVKTGKGLLIKLISDLVIVIE